MPAIQLNNRVLLDGVAHSLGDLAEDFARVPVLGGGAGAPLAIVGDDALDLCAAAAWLAVSETDGLLLPSERLTAPVRANLLERGYRLLHWGDGSVTEPATPGSAQRGRISLLTSGTTGVPKIIEHTWGSLFTMSRARSARPLNWLVSYAPGTYAWYQLLTLALFAPGQSLTLAANRDPISLVEAAVRHPVTAISATPTFWRMAIMQTPRQMLQAIPLEQITLGGERVDQAILDQLRELFPAASIAHIYASSEAGACIVVRDGREGFPAAWLGSGQRSDDAPQLDVREGRLWIRSPHASKHHGGWFNSGDAVEQREDRVFILGRADHSIINVGGMKLATCDVERQLLQHRAVQWCRVYGRRAPMVGELVAADVVLRTDAQANEADLAGFCAAHLADYSVPRIWNFLDRIPATDNLKTELRQAS